MRNIANYLSYLPKRILGLLLLTVLVAVPLMNAQASDSDGPRFNIYDDVFADGEWIGDESDFLRAGPVRQSFSANETADPYAICSGQADLWVYIHNGQLTIHNGDNYNGPGVADDTRVAVDLPNGAAKTLKPEATISASNATNLLDTATINCGDHEIELTYVPGTARGYTESRGNFAVSDQIVNGGVDIGTFADDGKVPGCWEYRIWVKLTVNIEKSEHPNYTTNKEVRHAGDSTWSKNTTASPGDLLEYRLTVKNTGDTTLKNVKVKDVLPEGLILKPGSVNVNGATGSGNLFSDSGMILDKIEPGKTVYITFKTTVDGELYECEAHKLRNKVWVMVKEVGTKDAFSTVTVDYGPCEVPIYTCDALATEQLSKNSFKFTASATAEGGAEIQSYVFFVNGEEVQRSDSRTYTLNEDTPGTYKVRVDVVVKVDGQVKTVTSPDCKTSVEVKEEVPDPIYTCDALKMVELDDRFVFTTVATAKNGATIVEYVYSVNGDRVLTVNDNVFELEKSPGKYTVRAAVVFDVNGDIQTVTSPDCVQIVEVPEDPIYTCDALKLIDRDNDRFVFEASHTAENGAEFVEYNFYVNGELVQESVDPEFILEPADTGNYRVVAKVVFNVNGEQKVVSSDRCEKTVDVVEEIVPIFECVAVNATIDNELRRVALRVDTIAKDGAVVKHFVYDFGDGSEALTTTDGETVYVYDLDGTYEIDVTVAFIVNDEIVVVHCEASVTFDNEVPPAPVPPAKELPNTGAVSAVASLIGTGALSMTARNWYTSRNNLRNRLLGKEKTTQFKADPTDRSLQSKGLGN